MWYISAPLWAWKAIVLLGGLVGTLSYIRSSNGGNGTGRRRQTSPEATVEFKAMIIAVFIHLFLLFFELFLCYQVRLKAMGCKFAKAVFDIILISRTIFNGTY